MNTSVVDTVTHLSDGLWCKLQEMADNTSCSLEETSSITEESDSMGSNRNSSPDTLIDKVRLADRNSSSSSSSSSSAFLTMTKSPLIQVTSKLNRLSPMVTGNASVQLQRQILASRLMSSTSDLEYDRRTPGSCVTPSSNSSRDSMSKGSPDLWDVRTTKSYARILPSTQRKSSSSSATSTSPKISKNVRLCQRGSNKLFDKLNDGLILKILSYLNANDLVRCSRVSRRFYFITWEAELWTSVTMVGENTDVDLALKTVMRLLARNSSKYATRSLNLNGCARLTDRGLAIIARTCPQLIRLEVQSCINITNGGLMDLVSKCHKIDHLDISGCQMISTISVHQPPPYPPHRTLPGLLGGTIQPAKRLLNIQYLDLTDCTSLEDSGLKIIVENCPQINLMFLRRCFSITDTGVKYITSYCLHLRELSISDCVQITDYGMYEVAKLGPNLRYLSVAKCNQITDSGIKQVARLCYKLRYLNIRGCELVSDDAIELVARSCSRIRSLDIGKCDVTDVGLKLVSEYCPNLKKLSVKSCEMISDTGIQSVAYYCRGLQQLNIQDCPVSLEGYRMVKKFCKKCIIEHSHPGFF